MSNPIKPTLKTEIFPVLLIILILVSGVYFYNNLPETIATHWNFAGQADSYGSGKTQVIAISLLIIGMYLLLLFVPYLDPRKERYQQFNKVYHIFKGIILAMLAVTFFVTNLNGLGYNLPVGIIIPVLIGLLFIIIGNYLGKVKRNWFVGIRTPWTMSSEEVWNKTHRFGGKMFILAGLLLMVETILPISWRLPVFIAAMAILLFGTIGYSYLVYWREKKNGLNK